MSRPVIIFYDSDFPISSSIPSDAIVSMHEFGTIVNANQLAAALKEIEGGCFINLHAPYFPKSAWIDILGYLQRGGGLISIGGSPFKQPVRWQNEQWHVEAEQTSYHQELYIHEVLRVECSRNQSLLASDVIPLLKGQESLFLASAETWNLVPHTTKTSDLPHQMGSAGPMSTRIYPLLKGITHDGRETAAPVVLWENTIGLFAGSRWMFVNTAATASLWMDKGLSAISKWARFCSKGVTEMWVKPNYASYESGERASLTLQIQQLKRAKPSMRIEDTWNFTIHVEHESDSSLHWSQRLEMKANAELNIVRVPIPLEIRSGLFQVVCEAEAGDGEVRILRQGFWGHAPELLAAGEPVTSGRDYFIKDGRPLPVVGMTYMTSDVARKFLFLPNVGVWDRDMGQMRKAGINWIRTGIWTAYRNVMQDDGHVSEEVMRAIDAFIMTAKKHDLQVTFTFFSFTPETWGGVNPYLDPQSVEAQKRFIRSIVSRHKASSNVDWDLINEPSMFDSARIFSEGPSACHDRFEQQAFVEWLQHRHGEIEVLQERWNMTPAQLPNFASAGLPEAKEINFDVQDMHSAKRGTRWLDYCLFSMDMHNRWVKQLYDTIKEQCPVQLVTVGQDEGLGAQRPSPFFYEEAVDYTTVHSWWFNDYLVWDGIFAKTPNKPNLIQETGVMYVETPDGRAKRSEQELRNLLERKYAYAFGTAGAGAIHWIWNTNFYMDNANESHIGALRADGTEKPEADVSYDFGKFIEGIRDVFGDRKLEEIAVVFPYSNDFSNRKLAFAATTELTRILSYDLKMPFRGASDYHLDDLENYPVKLIMLPSAHNFDDAAMERLLHIVEETGAVLLATGPLGIDAYWRSSERFSDILGKRELRNVRREEVLNLQGQVLPVSFGHRRIAEVSKETIILESGGSGSPTIDSVINIPLGKGRLLWSPLPLELSDRSDTTSALYRYALSAAHVECDFEWISGGDLAGIYGRKLSFNTGALFTFVSEYAHDAKVEVKDSATGRTYAFLLEQERSVLFATDTKGDLLGVYRPQEVEIHVSYPYLLH